MALGTVITLSQSFLHRFIEKEIISFLVIGGMLLLIGAFAWAYTSITCPECKLKLFWYSITKVGLGTWFIWLTDLETCPHCEKMHSQSVPAYKRRKSKGR